MQIIIKLTLIIPPLIWLANKDKPTNPPEIKLDGDKKILIAQASRKPPNAQAKTENTSYNIFFIFFTNTNMYSFPYSYGN